MFIVFEGIDGSGKTTISNRIAQRLRARGLTVQHAREGGAFASTVTQGIRDFCRDARNLALVPRAELLLYVAREVQLAEEVLRPAQACNDVVISDRYLYTAEVLARAGRDLPEHEIRSIIAAAAGAFWPDLVFLIDVDPSIARGRRKVAKLLSSDRRPGSRKGLTGSGLQQQLRQGYRDLADRDRQRWIVIDNSQSDLDRVVASILSVIDIALRDGVSAAVASMRKPIGETAQPRAIEDPQAALALFVDWIDRRRVQEPMLAAYVLAGLSGPGINERRLALAASAPRVVARGLRGMSDGVSWQLRRLLLEAAPREIALSLEEQAAEGPESWAIRELLAGIVPTEVAQSLAGLDDETAWALREVLYPRVPDAVLESVGMLPSQRAAGLRERWIAERGGLDGALGGYWPARALARSVTGIDGDTAWALRQAARRHAPVAALASLRGLTSEIAWSWRQQAIGRAPRAVLSTIAGMDEPRAWPLREAVVAHCREALDSIIGLDHPLAWQMRENYLEVWPANAVKSLGVLVNGPRGQALLRRALATSPAGISLLKQAVIIATGSNLTANVMAA